MINAAPVHKALLISLCALPMVVLVRLYFLPVVTSDYVNFLHYWYSFIQEKGLANAYGEAFSDYPPLYTYLLGIMGAIAPNMSSLTGIKFISFCAESVAAFYTYRIIRLYRPDSLNLAVAGAWMLLLTPTLLADSLIWVQCDMLHTAAIIAAIYYFACNRSMAGMLAFSIACAFKWQGLFLAPAVAVLILRRSVPIHYLLLVPVIYLLSLFPAWLEGRSLPEMLGIFFGQFESKRFITGGPNPYMLVNPVFYYEVVTLGLTYTALILSLIVAKSARSHTNLDAYTLLLLTTMCALLMYFILPKMYERYITTASVLAVPLFFCRPAWSCFTVILLIQTAIFSYLEMGSFHHVTPYHVLYGLIAYGVALALLVREWKTVFELNKQSSATGY